MRMSLQQVKIACLHYDHTMPLFEGEVKIEGVDAAFERGGSWRATWSITTMSA
jgi:hypothetical protein